MRGLYLSVILFIACYPLFCQQRDSSRIAVFYKAGRDVTMPLKTKEEAPLPAVGEAIEKGLRQSDFVQLHFGLVYQMPNGWGLGGVYSDFATPDIATNSDLYFETCYPEYRVVNRKGIGKLGLRSQFVSLHVEHSFQRKFLFFSPYANAGLGYVKPPHLQAFMKQPDANRYLSADVGQRSPLSASYTVGVDLGVRFYKNLFTFCFSPSLGHYQWRWTQTDSSIDFYGRKTSTEQNFSIRQTHFLLMVNFGVRLPLQYIFYETL